MYRDAQKDIHFGSPGCSSRGDHAQEYFQHASSQLRKFLGDMVQNVLIDW
jgi:hypothetical protein